MSWLTDFAESARKKLDGTVYSGSMRGSYGQGHTFGDPQVSKYYHDDLLSQYQSMTTERREGAAPRWTDYITVTPGTMLRNSGDVNIHTMGMKRPQSYAIWSDPTMEVDQETYLQDMFDYMRGSRFYDDWTDDDIREFAAESMGMTEGERQASELWYDSRIAEYNAQQQAQSDRTHMLAEIQAFRDGWNDEWMRTAIARERQTWDARKSAGLKEATERASQAGITLSPWVMGEISRRYDAQTADAVQTLQMNLEQQRQDVMSQYVSLLGSVYANTDIQTTDASTAAALAQALGESEADSVSPWYPVTTINTK